LPRVVPSPPALVAFLRHVPMQRLQCHSNSASPWRKGSVVLPALLASLLASGTSAYQECQGSGLGLPAAATCQAGVLDCSYCADADALQPGLEQATCASYAGAHANPEGDIWMVAVGGAVAMVMAFGIGGNDSANSWGTSVGSGAISLRKACLLGGLAEFLGATFLGAGVSSTIQKGVASVLDEDCWACGNCDSRMAMYQFGMFAALCGAAFFLLLVTFFALPVSTTHAIVGGVVGMTVTAIGGGCLNWKMSGGLGGIVVSWVASPLFAGIVGSIMYVATYFAVFKARSPKRAALVTVPMLYGLSVGTMVFLILKKSNLVKKLLTDAQRAAIAMPLLVVVPAVVHLLVMPGVRKQMNDLEKEEEERDLSSKGKDAEAPVPASEQDVAGEPGEPATAAANEGAPASSPEGEIGMVLCKTSVPTKEQRIAKKAFQNLLVFNALVESFAHGANDTANATGPFGAIYNTYKNGLYACGGEETPWYIMAIAGLCVALGVNTMGHRVIRTMGEEITEIDFHIGYCVEFASGFSVICATLLGMPVSTTHCQVGAVVFVGALASGMDQVSWRMFGKIALTWVATLPLSGGLSALLLFLRYARIAY